MIERQLERPLVKDYDAIRGAHPRNWSSQFDVSNWGFIVARKDGKRVGGAVIAFKCPQLGLMEETNFAVLWDIRVDTAVRGEGVGGLLVQAAEQWCVAQDCIGLRVETQNTNPAACRFYIRHGFALEAVNYEAYPDLPDEVQLLFYKDLSK